MPPVFKGPFPIFTVTDIERSIAFYRDGLGFSAGFQWPPDGEGPLEFAVLALDGREIGLGQAPNEFRSVPIGVELCIRDDWCLIRGPAYIMARWH